MTEINNWNGKTSFKFTTWIFKILSSVITLVLKEHPFSERDYPKIPGMEQDDQGTSDALQKEYQSFIKEGGKIEQFVLDDKIYDKFMILNFYCKQPEKGNKGSEAILPGIGRIPFPQEIENAILKICQRSPGNLLKDITECRKRINTLLQNKRSGNKSILKSVTADPKVAQLARWKKP